MMGGIERGAEATTSVLFPHACGKGSPEEENEQNKNRHEWPLLQHWVNQINALPCSYMLTGNLQSTCEKQESMQCIQQHATNNQHRHDRPINTEIATQFALHKQRSQNIASVL